MPDTGGKLTVRQGKFVEHYALCGNAAEAARLAGYSARSARVTGPETLLKPAIREALQARQRVFAQELGVTKQDVINGLQEAIVVAKSQLNPGAMISGLAQIAKLCGFYEPEVHKVDMAIDTASLRSKFAAMSDEELLSVINSSQATT